MKSKKFLFFKKKSKKKSNKSTKTVQQLGFNYQMSEGIFTYSPLGFRLLKKLIKFLSKKTRKIGAIETLMPSIQKIKEKESKKKRFNKEIFKIKKNIILNPTHEEVFIKDMIEKIKEKEYPKIFFQISNKFRNEVRQKGFIRTKEFIMKDTYSFSKNYKCLKKCYNKIIDLYCRIFKKLKIKYIKIKSKKEEGEIKCKKSVEFHVITKEGEKNIILKKNKLKKIKNYEKNKKNKTFKSIEIAHCFLIGKKKQKKKQFYFGSYGIGVSRLYYLIIKNRLKKGSIFNKIINIKYIILTTNKKFNKKAKEIYKIIKKKAILDNRNNIKFRNKLEEFKNLGFYILIISRKIKNEKLVIINKRNKMKEIEIKKLFKKFKK